jgi:hypothetical protein
MICNATYENLTDIPDALRDEFEQVNGKWQLKASAVPGVGPLFNSALAANEKKAVDQVKNRNDKIRGLEEENSSLKDKLAVLDSPGNKVLSKADADTFDAFVALGTPAEIKAKLEKLPELEGKVTQFETAQSLTQVSKANGLGDVKLNPEVLTDWLAAPENKGVTVFVKTEEKTDAKGVKTSVEVPYVRVEALEDGKTKVSEKELLTFAKEKMKEYQYTALVSGAAETVVTGKGKTTAQTTNGNGSRLQVPDLGSARQEPGNEGDKKRPVDKFNEARAARPSPFANRTAAVVAGVPTGAPKV